MKWQMYSCSYRARTIFAIEITIIESEKAIELSIVGVRREMVTCMRSNLFLLLEDGRRNNACAGYACRVERPIAVGVGSTWSLNAGVCW
jgi:hypothetical protein